MKNPRTYLATAAAIGLVGLAAGTFTHKAIADVAEALLVRDADNPARQPFQVECDITQLSEGCSLITVSKGKRLVIETVTAILVLPEGAKPLDVYVRTIAGRTRAKHALVARFMGRGTTSVPFDYFAVSEAVHLYADPGTSVFMGGLTSTVPPASEDDLLTISGHFVDAD